MKFDKKSGVMPVGSSICVTRIEDDVFVVSATCVDLNTLLPIAEPFVFPPVSGATVRDMLTESFEIGAKSPERN